MWRPCAPPHRFAASTARAPRPQATANHGIGEGLRAPAQARGVRANEQARGSLRSPRSRLSAAGPPPTRRAAACRRAVPLRDPRPAPAPRPAVPAPRRRGREKRPAPPPACDFRFSELRSARWVRGQEPTRFKREDRFGGGWGLRAATAATVKLAARP